MTCARSDRSTNVRKDHRREAYWLALLFVPAFLNDFAYIRSTSTNEWLAANYLTNLVMLSTMLGVRSFRACVLSSLSSPRKPHEPLMLTCLRVSLAVWASVLAMMLVELVVWRPLTWTWPDTALFSYPKFTSPLSYWFDATIGLALTAVTEELACRSIGKWAVEKFNGKTVLQVFITSAIFGLAHWSNGIPNVVANFFSGIVLMVLYLRMKSIVPSIAAHYLILVWYFHDWHEF